MQYPHPVPNWPFPVYKDYPYKAPREPKRDPVEGIPVAPF